MKQRKASIAKRRSVRSILAASAAASAMLGMQHVVSAGTFNWLSTTDDTWSDPLAWDAGALTNFDNTTSLVFGQGSTASSYTATNDVPPTGGTAFTLNSLTFNTTAGDSTNGGITLATVSPSNTLVFAGTSPSINMTGGGSATINHPVTYAPNMTVTNSGSGVLTIGAVGTTQAFAGGMTFSNNGTGTLVLADGAIMTNGTGTINLANNNTIVSSGTFTPNFQVGNFASTVNGTVNVTTGYVTFAGNTAGDLFGSNTILNVAPGGTFDFAGNGETMGGITGGGVVTGANVTFTLAGDRTFSGGFIGAINVAQNVASVLTLSGSGSNTYSGQTIAEAGGTIRAEARADNAFSPNSLVSITALAGTIDLATYSEVVGGITGGDSTNAINIASGATLTINAVSNTARAYTGALTGPGNFTFGLNSGLSGTSMQSILGSNTYSGLTTVTGGTLRLNAPNLPGGAGVSIAAAGTLDAIFPVNASFTAPLSGSGTFITEGPGTLTFSGANPSANLSGLTQVAGGIVLDNTSNTGNKIGSSTSLTLNSATLTLLGNGSTATTQSFSGTTLTGAGNLKVTSGSGQSATMALGAITRNAGSTVNFVPVNTGGGTASFTTTTANTTAGFLGGHATFNGTDWAVATGAGPTFTIAAMSAGSYSAASWGTGKHTDVTASNVAAATGSSTNDARFNTAANDKITISGTATLITGGVLVTPNVGAFSSTITGGTLSLPANQDLILNQFNPSGGLSLVSSIANTAGTPITTTANSISSTAATQTLTVTSTAGLSVGMSVAAGANLPANWNGHVVSVNSPTSVTIAYFNSLNPTAGPNIPVTFTPQTNIVKSGVGTATLSTSNNFAGAIVVNQGVLDVSNATTSFGAGFQSANYPNGSSSLYLNGGTIEFASSYAPGPGNQPWTIGPAGGTIQVDGTASATRTGFGLYGSGNITKVGTGSLAIASDSSPISGNIFVNQGILSETSSQIESAGNVTIASGAAFLIRDNGAASFKFATASILSLTGDGPAGAGAFQETIQNPGPGPISTIPNEIFLAGNSARVGMYQGTGTGSAFTGATIFSGPVIGPGALVKDGPGTLTLSGTVNNYGYSTSLLGATIISNGTLILGAKNALPTNGTLQFGESSILFSNSGALDMKGFNQTVTGLITQGSGPAQQIANSGPGITTLTVNIAPSLTDTFSGQIGLTTTSNGIALVKTGSGTLALSANNSYSGATSITAGTLLVSGALAATSGINLDATTADTNLVLNNTTAVATTAQLTAISTGAHTPSLYVDGGGSSPATPQFASVTFSGNGTSNTNINVVNAIDTLTIGTLTNTAGGIGTAITKVGPGALTITGPQSYGAGASLAVNAGTVNMASDGGGSLAVTVAAPATFNATAGQTIPSLCNAGVASFSGGASTIGSIGGVGSLLVDSTATVTAVNSLNQGALNSTGTVAINGGVNTIGSIDGTGVLIVGSGVSLTANDLLDHGTLNSSGTVAINGGVNTVGSIDGTGVLIVGSGVSLTASNLLNHGSINSAGTINVNGGATNVVGPIDGTGTLNVNAGTLTATHYRHGTLAIASGATATIADSTNPGNTVATGYLNSLSVDAAGTLDIMNNSMVIDYGAGSSPITSVVTSIKQAYNGGAWDQPGITSTSARNNSINYGIGYAEASALGSTAFEGQTFSGNAVLIKYTLQGDTTLKGSVDGGDYNTVIRNFNKSGQGWSDGNFDYTGTVSGADYNAVIRNFNHSASGSATNSAAFVGPVAPPSTHGVTRAAGTSASSSGTSSDMRLEVNTVNGDVSILATTAVSFSLYNIFDASSKLRVNSAAATPPERLLSISGANTTTYSSYSRTTGTVRPTRDPNNYQTWNAVGESKQTLSEGQKSTYSSTDSTTWNTLFVPVNGVIDLGLIFNTLTGVKDLTFQFSEASASGDPVSGVTFSNAPVDYIGGSVTPEPGSVSLLAIGAMGLLGRRRRRAAAKS